MEGCEQRSNIYNVCFSDDHSVAGLELSRVEGGQRAGGCWRPGKSVSMVNREFKGSKIQAVQL